MTAIFNYELDGVHHYIVPGRIWFCFEELPFSLIVCTDPNLLECLVESSNNPLLLSDENIRKIKVPIELWERVEEAIDRKSHLAFFNSLYKIEHYGET